MRQSVLGALLCCVLVFLLASPASGQEEDATTATITSATVYSGVIETGDRFVVVRFDIVNPETFLLEPASNLFNIQISADINGQPKLLGVVRISELVDNGYSPGIVGLYFSAVTAKNAGYAEDAVTTAKVISFEDYPPAVSIAEQEGIWRPTDRETLARDMVALFRQLQETSAWITAGLVLVNSLGFVTEDPGEGYIVSVIPAARSVLPSLFSTGLGYPEFTFLDRPGNSEAEAIDERLENSEIISTSFQGLGEWTGIPQKTVSTLIVLVFASLCAYYGMKVSGSGLVVIPCMAVVLGAGALLGFVPMTFLAIMGAMCALAISFLLFLKRTG